MAGLLDTQTYSPQALFDNFEMPQKVRVTRGWLADREEDSLSEGELLTVFFARQERVVVAEDRLSRAINIPLDCAISFKALDAADATSEDSSNCSGSGSGSGSGGGGGEGELLRSGATVGKFFDANAIPCRVAPVEAKAAIALGSRSATASIRLIRVEKQDFLYAGNVKMGDLLCIPVSLGVEFSLLGRKKKRLHKNRENPYAIHPVYESLVNTVGSRGVGSSLFARKGSLLASSSKSKGGGRSGSVGTSGSKGDVEGGESSLAFRRQKLEEADKVYLEIWPTTDSSTETDTDGGDNMVTGINWDPRYGANGNPSASLGPGYETISIATDSVYACADRYPTETVESSGAGGTGDAVSGDAVSGDTASGNAASTSAMAGVTNTLTTVPLASSSMSDMTVDEVCNLLKQNNLGQYEAKFRAEMITGDLFVSLDSDMLQDDLGVTSKLHRLRLLKLAKKSF